MTSLAAWGPTLVMAIAVLTAGVISLRFARGTPNGVNRNSYISDKGSAALLAALREAESINAYRTHLAKIYLKYSFEPNCSYHSW